MLNEKIEKTLKFNNEVMTDLKEQNENLKKENQKLRIENQKRKLQLKKSQELIEILILNDCMDELDKIDIEDYDDKEYTFELNELLNGICNFFEDLGKLPEEEED